ncbi:tyrosine-type recombinase/integrase [Bradyrhizobium aeschynomenes]|uniref:tyrosine-type recombinase/integrase n=1 Tax=Bradyrhizobium aeschynomenes TaxID=2734909 RepID=UPI00155531D5|nr:tyrosine-type recombinase/integrase [Bradyrhizobium aeschynomenes]NPV19279.1 tyrosine-type recombinase/integrase [Bradyrhizobium aeschynomenes]
MPRAPRQFPSLPPPGWAHPTARTNSGLDKTWGQGHWADIADGAIRVARQKTTTKLTIPIHEALESVLSTANRGHPTILATAYGERFSVKGFGQMISAAIREAGLPERCKAHGLRKAAARRLAEAGCSASEIAAITGHKTLAEVERHTRAADQERLARQAIQRQSKNKSGKPPIGEVANSAADVLEINSLAWKMALPRGIEPLCISLERHHPQQAVPVSRQK